jgi:uncharacterized protein YegJ (DUF2314 family)
MRTLVKSLAVLIFFAFWSCSRNKEGNNYVHVNSEDKALNEAILNAKATSADFLKAFHDQRPGTKDFYVKKPYDTPSGSLEHMWIEVTEEARGVLRGIIANEAEETRVVKRGEKVSLEITEISDWKYQDGKKLIGGFTIRYFLDKMSPEEREAFLKDAGFEL